VGIIGGAAVDKFGNVNTTAFWATPPGANPGPPKTRLPGSGGANDIACGCKRVVIMMTHEKKRFVERLDYITSPGYLFGADDREKYNFIGGGPVAIVTTLGVLRPHPVSKEFQLVSYHAFSSVDEVKANTGWDLKVAGDVGVTPVPTEGELKNLRAVDVTGMLKKQ
jgi:glutaconate CoA-transferase subunit B